MGNRKLIPAIFYTFVKKNRKPSNNRTLFRNWVGTLSGMVLWDFLYLLAPAKLEAVQKIASVVVLKMLLPYWKQVNTCMKEKKQI